MLLFNFFTGSSVISLLRATSMQTVDKKIWFFNKTNNVNKKIFCMCEKLHMILANVKSSMKFFFFFCFLEPLTIFLACDFLHVLYLQWNYLILVTSKSNEIFYFSKINAYRGCVSQFSFTRCNKKYEELLTHFVAHASYIAALEKILK